MRNSLQMLPENVKYDVVIMDEVGMVRRHFLSSITSKVLGKAYGRFVSLMKNAMFVTMLQDTISVEDVRFCTEVADVQYDDTTKVGSFRFVKPTRMHPIQYTTDYRRAMLNLEKCYNKSFEDEAGVSQEQSVHPYMVFCSSVQYAGFVVCWLRAMAKGRGKDPERVKGVWASLKHMSDYGVRFGKDPSSAAPECDALEVTSVIGVGFSINTHFISFHAFLTNRILNHDDEKQFIRRLRFFITSLPRGAIRQSYLFVEKGCGTRMEFHRVLEDYAMVRKLLMAEARVGLETVGLLEETQAQVRVETSYSRLHHDTLWMEWGKSVESEFVAMEGEEAEEQSPAEQEKLEAMAKKFVKWKKKKQHHIMDLIKDEEEELGHELSDMLEELEVGSALGMYGIAADANDALDEWDDVFYSSKVAKLILQRELGERGYNEFITSSIKRTKLAKKCRNLAR